MKTNLFLTSTLILFSTLATAQQVSNIDFTQGGKTIKITYDLLGETSQSYEVKVWYTTDEGQNWHGPLQYVSGDVGKNQKPGYTKTMVWDVLKEMDKLTAYIDFKIEVVIGNLNTKQTQQESFYHIIKKGQTLYSIAELYKVSIDQILNANPYITGSVKIGDYIKIPIVKEISDPIAKIAGLTTGLIDKMSYYPILL